jgi:hypothetical protein
VPIVINNNNKPVPENAHNPRHEWRVLAHRGGDKIQLENEGELDEVVLHPWFHLEQMDEDLWWLRVGHARILVNITPDGTIRLDIEQHFYSGDER